MNQTAELFGDLELNLYVLSEGNLSQHGLAEHFESYRPFYLDALSVEEAFGTMVDASVLITSGSSFAWQLFTSGAQIALQIKPKEGNKGSMMYLTMQSSTTLVLLPIPLQAN